MSPMKTVRCNAYQSLRRMGYDRNEAQRIARVTLEAAWGLDLAAHRPSWL